MVSISNEANHLPRSNSYEKTDEKLNSLSTKLLTKLQPTLHPHCEAQEYEMVIEPITHHSCLSCNDSHQPAEYNKLAYSTSEKDLAG